MAKHETVIVVKKILRDSLRLGSEAEIADDMPLAGGRHDLDSLDILLVVTNIEKELGIKIVDRDMGKHVFATVTTLAEFVDAHRS